MRLVDADAILEKIDKERKYLIARGQIGAEHILVKHCRDFVEDAPTITPEWPKGEWIIVDDTEKFIAKCSVCGRIEDSRMVKDYPFCHCGAKMGGKK